MEESEEGKNLLKKQTSSKSCDTSSKLDKQNSILIKQGKELAMIKKNESLFFKSIKSLDFDEPKVKKGNKHSVSVMRESFPGPGAYSPQEIENSRRIFHKISNSPEHTRESITSNIDFIDYRMFPTKRHVSIGGEGHKEFYSYDVDVPGPKYDPQPVTVNRYHQIASRRPETTIKDDIPGPGHYDPKLDRLNPIPCTSKSKRVMQFDEENGNPGPGQYDPNFYAQLEVKPKWSIGKKDRNRKRRRNDPPALPKGKMIGIANFLIQLEGTMDEKEAYEFIKKHPEIKTIIMDIMKEILDSKPNDPIVFIHDHYCRIRSELYSSFLYKK